MSAVWNCPDCGPVRDALHGEDGLHHCANLDCDQVVQLLDEQERKPTQHPKAFTIKAFPEPRSGTKTPA